MIDATINQGLPVDSSRLESLVAVSRKAIAKGSLSFSLASRLLPTRLRDSIVLLYYWCRSCDDLADNLPSQASEQERADLIGGMVRWTKNSTNANSVPAPFAALGILIDEFDVPMEYPLELLEGMRSDLFHSPCVDEKDLLQYCYRVAGTVGLIFSHVSGISDVRALRYAAHLGTAMQMTNIARDVFDDIRMGRVYLPKTWLVAEGIEGEDLTADQYREGLVRVVKRLLKVADLYYQSGDRGIKYLPLRSAFAVCAARHIYSEIGRMVEARGSHAWDHRCWVSLPRKLVLIARASWQVVCLIPGRLLTPFQPIKIQETWRFQWPEPKA